MEELSPDERYFLQMMFPHLVQGSSPDTPQAQSPISNTSRRESSVLFRSSSPMDLSKAPVHPPDWGPPITKDYIDTMSPPQPRSPRRSKTRFPQSGSPGRIPEEYSTDLSLDRNISDFYRSQQTEEFPWNVRDRLRYDREDESLLRRFDRGVRAELVRRRRAYSTGMSGVRRAADESDGPRTRSMTLAVQADNLAKAEALALFTEAVEAAEKAASGGTPASAERDAARAYEARLVEAVSGETVGSTPIEVVAYVGITQPKIPRSQRY